MKPFWKLTWGGLALAALTGCTSLFVPAEGVSTFYGYTTSGTVTSQKSSPWDRLALGPPELTVENNDWGIPQNGQGESTVFTETIGGSAAFGWAYQVTRGTNVVMYPEVGYGWSPNGNTSWGGNPIVARIGEDRSITSNFDIVSAHSDGGTWDLAYDLWITPTPYPSTVAGGFEVMIWLDHHLQGPWANSAPPGQVTIDGVSYNRYTNKGADAGWTVLTYINRGPAILHGDRFNLMDVIQDAAATFGIPRDFSVCAIEFGNEVVNGSGMTEISHWTIDVGPPGSYVPGNR
jgi:hypothetical protein